ncbi:Uncharacterised protein [Vibrio cholerae]|nr:Uncharacterised protein [Vibrio cholerae]
MATRAYCRICWGTVLPALPLVRQNDDTFDHDLDGGRNGYQ